MIYGKVQCRVPSRHGTVLLTVGDTTSIKQNGDLIRLSIDEARELLADLSASLAELEGDPSNKTF